MAISITAENMLYVDTHENYTVQFFTESSIYTTVTADPAIVTDWIDTIKYLHGLSGFIVGLDVEWRPNFSANQRRHPVATLQLCVGDRCLIYQIIHSHRIPESLADFLSQQFAITFAGVGIKSDLEKLQSDYGIGGGAHYMELRAEAAEAYGAPQLGRMGLKGLARAVLGKEVEKPVAVTISRWDNRWLTAEQVKYACVDAYLSFVIGSALIDRPW